MILPAPLVHPVPYSVLIFDADSTLRRCLVPGQVCPNQPGEWELMPGVREALWHYDWKHQHFFGMASHQGEVGLGFLSEQTARQLLYALAIAATHHHWPLRALQLCPHLPQDRCACRKPLGTMLEAVEMFWYSQAKIHGPGQCLFVGDQETDRQAAEAVRFPFAWAHDFFGWAPPG